MDLELQNLSMRYGKTNILFNLSVKLHSGGLIGLLGPNGAGKTTLLKLLTTLQKPSQGDILLNGTSIVSKPNAMRKVLGYLPQQVPYFPNLTVDEYLTYIANMKGIASKARMSQITFLLERLHLTDTKNKKLKDFSGGMRQRVGIAATLLNTPPVIIADEPTTGLDPEERVTLRNILGELANDHLVLVSTHIVSDIEAIASRILIIKNGKFLYQGSPTSLMKKCDGYVWQYPLTKVQNFTTSPGQLDQPTSSLIQQPTGVKVREITKQPLVNDAHQVLPSLEEAYLGALRGVVKI